MSDFPLPPLTAPPAWTVAAFVSVVVTVIACVIGAVVASAPLERRWRDAGVATIVLAVWLAITAIVPMSGVLARDGAPPPAMVFVVACNVIALVFALSPMGSRIARSIPAAALVGFHAFRLPLELVLERWTAAGTIPIQMSFHGDNFDIVTGILAIAVALVLARRSSPALELAFQILGLALLVRVASIAVMSAPGPLRAYDGILLQLPFHAPYAWIVSVCVAGALAGHVIGLRAVVRRLRARKPGPRDRLDVASVAP